jgi:hypothetical protein
MGRIKNKALYPIKAEPVTEDTVVGNDSEDGGKTVLFRLQKLLSQAGEGTPSIPTLQQVLEAGYETNLPISYSDGSELRCFLGYGSVLASGYAGTDLDNKILLNKDEIYFSKSGNGGISRLSKNNLISETDYKLELPAAISGTYTIPISINGVKAGIDGNIVIPIGNVDTVYTVSTLPTGVLNDMATVSDAIAPTYLGALTGGGSVVCPVWHNGTNWVSR